MNIVEKKIELEHISRFYAVRLEYKNKIVDTVVNISEHVNLGITDIEHIEIHGLNHNLSFEEENEIDEWIRENIDFNQRRIV